MIQSERFIRAGMVLSACLAGVLASSCESRVAGPNLPPVAVAGPDRSVVVGVGVELDGGASYDPDGEGLVYVWSLLAVPDGSQSGLLVETGRLSGLNPDRVGVYLVSLEVSDRRLISKRDILRVVALAGCEQDDQCDDLDPCTRDRCQGGQCFNEIIAGCVDLCPDDPDKFEPGYCGCGIPEDDADRDGAPDCVDSCPDDPLKSEPGECGCHNPETDRDQDAWPDCVDGCPDDPGKSEAGFCGCGSPDVDSDGDGAFDCLDDCPDDPDKLGPGVCGCGNPDVDTDADGLLDCQDPCPQDDPGDTDGDGHCDSDECAPLNPNAYPGAPERCNLVDDDCNGVVDDGYCLIGCSDGEREGFVSLVDHPLIAGCSGGWELAGVLGTTYRACGCNAGDDSLNPDGTGCCATDLCQPGWRVCGSSADVGASGANGCGGATQEGDPELFFATRQSGSGNLVCDPVGANDVFGCGNHGNGAGQNCAPLERSTGNLCNGVGPPWNCGTDSTDEANRLSKTGADRGGVLCCRTEEDCSSDPDTDGDGVQDGCDPCPTDPQNDLDGDGFCASHDSCPEIYNPGQVDADADGQGDVCDEDDDGDGALDPDDCAPLNPNVHPGALEICNGTDDDCDGLIDPGACPCPVENYNGHAYMFCAGPLDWSAARSACYQEGYTLAVVDDAQEDAWLWNTIIGLLGDGNTWHGFNDRSSEGDWGWENGSASVHTNWAEGEPNDSGWGGEDCGSWQTGHGGQWNDQDCGDQYAYVCESTCAGSPDADGDGWSDGCDCAPYNPNIFPGAPEVCNAKDDDCDGSLEPPSDCPCPVEDYAGHRYLFCTEELDWMSARAACRAKGFTLFTVDQAAEGNWSRGFILTHIGGRSVWLGFNDRLSESAWQWENDSPSTYTFWYAGEPNDYAGREDCANIVFEHSYWNDVYCTDAYPYICESDRCPNDPDNDIDGDGVCGNQDTCPQIYNPGQIGPCR